jgi:hypothetical protein
MEIGNSVFSSYAGVRSAQASERSNVSLGDSFSGALKQTTSDSSRTAAPPPSIPDELVGAQIAVDATIADETDSEMLAKSRHNSLVAELSKFASMSPAEMMRSKYLAAHGLTEESLRGMSSDDRAAIEKDIADSIKQSLADKDSASAVSDVPQGADTDSGNEPGSKGG